MTTPEQSTPPASAYPTAVWADDMRATLDRIRVVEGEHTIGLEVAAMRLSTSRHEDLTRLEAARDAMYQIGRAAGRCGDLLNVEVEQRKSQQRQLERQAELERAAVLGGERGHPYSNGHDQIVQVDAETARSLLGPVEPVDTEACQTLTLPAYEETADAAAAQ